jgi:hypothetical protein
MEEEEIQPKSSQTGESNGKSRAGEDQGGCKDQIRQPFQSPDRNAIQGAAPKAYECPSKRRVPLEPRLRITGAVSGKLSLPMGPGH